MTSMAQINENPNNVNVEELKSATLKKNHSLASRKSLFLTGTSNRNLIPSSKPSPEKLQSRHSVDLTMKHR